MGRPAKIPFYHWQMTVDLRIDWGKGATNGWTYPKEFWKTLDIYCPDMGSILQPFQGYDLRGTGVDIDIQRKPDIVGDALNLPIKSKSFDTVIADPPYPEFTRHRSLRFMHEMEKVSRKYVIVLHWVMMPLIRPLRSEFFAVITFRRTYNYARILSVFKIKEQIELF